MNNQVILSEENGLTLTLSPAPNRDGVLIADLTGTDLHIRTTVDWEPAIPQLGHLNEFFATPAQRLSGKSAGP
jgi:hypothetical protein